mgnify:FL=1
MKVYESLFYIAEEKRFVRWEDYLAYYKLQDKERV